MISNKVYNVLKYIALIALPAVVTLLIGIGDVWGLSWMPKVAMTVSLITSFLGALLQVSSTKYWKEQNNEEKVDG